MWHFSVINPNDISSFSWGGGGGRDITKKTENPSKYYIALTKEWQPDNEWVNQKDTASPFCLHFINFAEGTHSQVTAQ